MNLSPKVQNSRLTENEYRKLKTHLSYSYIKLFDNDREQFYKEMVLGEPVKEKQSASLIMGSLIHCLLAGSEHGGFDEKFHLGQSLKPTGQMGDLCDALYTRSLQSMNEYNEQQDSFKSIFTDAVQKVKYDYEGNEIAFKKKDEAKILEMFEGSNSELYYRECLEAIGKTVISVPLLEQAERLVQKVKENPVTERYVNQQTEWLDHIRDIKAIEVFNELPIIFEINEVPCKILPDRLHVDHINKTIEPFDWKCSAWDNESPEYAYIKYSYYLQAAFYDMGLSHWQKEHKIEEYTRLPIKFVFIDVTGFNSPCIVMLSQDDLDRAHRGFKLKGNRYRGITELMGDIQWHLDTGIWNQSREIYNNGGKIQLKLAYGNRG